MQWTYGGIDVLPNFAGELETDADSTPFWEGLAEGEVRVQRCQRCGTHRFPPGPFCLHCGSGELVYVPLTSRPRLFSWIVVTRSTHASMRAPYVVAVVEYDEGVRIPGALQVSPGVNEITIDMPVSVTVEKGERPFIAFHIIEPTATLKSDGGAAEQKENKWLAV